MDRPLVSICVPTYNRAEVLAETMGRMLALDEFDDDVEIVVSDNCSTDSTAAAVKALQAEYPGKRVRYFRNEENVRDWNFYLALSRGEGKYLKLYNDYSWATGEGLRLMKEAVNRYYDTDCNVFFIDRMLHDKGSENKVYDVDGPDGLIRYAYHTVTWISNFGIWDRDLPILAGFRDRSSSQLLQMHWMLHLSSCRATTRLYNFFETKRVDVRNSLRVPYNVFSVLVDNYFNILGEYEAKGLVSAVTIRKDKTRALKTFVGWSIRDLLILGKDTSYSLEGAWDICWRHFRTQPYFYFIFLKALYRRMTVFGKSKK